MLWRRPLAGQLVQKSFAVAFPVSRRSLAAMASAASEGGRGSIAVVGGGVSGLYCASMLAKQGHDVTVFDLGKHCPGAAPRWQRQQRGGRQARVAAVAGPRPPHGSATASLAELLHRPQH